MVREVTEGMESEQDPKSKGRDDVDLSCGSGVGKLWETHNLGVILGC